MNKPINCLIVDDELIAREIIHAYIDKCPELRLVHACKNVKEAIEVKSKEAVDLIFLDINMPEISGLTFAKIIDKKVKIIFTTAHRAYAVEGFDINAIDYLLKPISFDRFKQGVEKYKSIAIHSEPHAIDEKEKENPDFIFIRSDRKMMKINFDEINYIESLSDYLKIHTSQGIVITRESISNMEDKLPDGQFIRIHRSYITSIKKIDAYTNEFIEINEITLPISRSYKDRVVAVLNRYQ